MINFNRRFIKGGASILKPLTDVMKGGGPKHRKLDWQPDMEKAFKKAKVALSEVAILAHLLSEPELSLAVDASDHHVGRVLQQKCAASWQPDNSDTWPTWLSIQLTSSTCQVWRTW